jgi:hypothetical protein
MNWIEFVMCILLSVVSHILKIPDVVSAGWEIL